MCRSVETLIGVAEVVASILPCFRGDELGTFSELAARLGLQWHGTQTEIRRQFQQYVDPYGQ